MISTSWFSNVRKRIKRSTEKPSSRYFERADILGWLMPSNSAALPCDTPRRRRTSLIATASRTLVWRSPASAKPRSAKTFPEPRTIFTLLFALDDAISILVILSRQSQTPENEFRIRFRRLNARARLLLETLQHIYRPPEADGVDGPIRVSVVILNNLQYSRSGSLLRFGRRVFPSELSDPECRSDSVFDRLRKL